MSKTSLVLASAIILSSYSQASSAQFSTQGVIKSIHRNDHVVHLNGGDAYRLPTGADISQLRPGDHVTLGWNSQHPATYPPLSSDNKQVWLLQAESLSPNQ